MELFKSRKTVDIPTVSLGAKVTQMVERFFAGSPEEMVTALIEYRGLTKQEAERIRLMIEKSEDGEEPGEGN